MMDVMLVHFATMVVTSYGHVLVDQPVGPTGPTDHRVGPTDHRIGSAWCLASDEAFEQANGAGA